MRALTGGSLVLAFAVVLLSWDVSRRFAHVSRTPSGATFERGEHGMHVLSAPRAPAPGEAIPQNPASGNVAAGPFVPDTARRPIAGAKAPSSEAPAMAPRGTAAPALPVRQHTPGSKEHVQAIATAIASEESRINVEPIARLYFAFFNRFSDYEGLNYWIDERGNGASLESIADEFAGSLEFGLRYGTLDNAAFIDRMFASVFDAPPDNAQRAYWMARLESGTTRGQVMLAFSESAAFRAATSNEVFVTLAYAQALRREPDADGFARWVRFLDAGHSRDAVIAGLLARR